MSSSSVQQIRHKTSLIQSIPVEILTMIFLLVGPASFNNPYVYLPLSWVCHYWRSIVLGNPKFWTVIGYKARKLGKSDDFVREAIRRSEPHTFDFFTCPRGIYHNGCPSHYTQFIVSECSRIKTLFIRNQTVFKSKYITWPVSFPQLENLILCNGIDSLTEAGEDSLHQLFLACRPRYVELPWVLLDKPIFHSLSCVEWLKINFTGFYGLSAVHNLLEHLPNLRVLNLIAKDYYWSLRDNDTSVSAPITLPKNLRMLSLNPGRSGFRSIHPPILDYLGISHSPNPKLYNWDLLGSINLLMIESVRVKLHEVGSDDKDLDSCIIACISTGPSDGTCQLFKNFHKQVSVSQANVDDHLILPPKNSLHLELPWSEDFGTLFYHLKRATNLAELTLDYQSLRIAKKRSVLVIRVLDSFDTIARLNLLGSRYFASVCKLLRRGRRVPRLERLTYHSTADNRVADARLVAKEVKMMQEIRIKNCCKPLRILKLREPLLPEEVKEIEGLGVQLIQT